MADKVYNIRKVLNHAKKNLGYREYERFKVTIQIMVKNGEIKAKLYKKRKKRRVIL